MTEKRYPGKLSQLWSQFRQWWRQLRPKQPAAEQIIQADQAEMDWADDGGKIVPINVEREVLPGE